MGRCAVMVLLYLFWLQIYVYLFIYLFIYLLRDFFEYGFELFLTGIFKIFKISSICVGEFVWIINNVFSVYINSLAIL